MKDPFKAYRRPPQTDKPRETEREDDDLSYPVYESGRESLMPEEENTDLRASGEEPAQGTELPPEAADEEAAQEPDIGDPPAQAEEERRPTLREERARRAQAAWAREAQRVDDSAPDAAVDAWAEADLNSGGEDEAKKPSKKTRKQGRKGKMRSAREEKRNFLKIWVIGVVCAVMFIAVALMIVSCFVSEESAVYPLLALPRRTVTKIVTPVQEFFSGFTGSVADYVRMLKVRGNIEYEYEKLLRQLDDYANESAQLEELRRINNSLYDLLDEQDRNRELDPVAATVIGTDANSYFSTLTLDVGTRHGVEDYMAVVAQGGLVGVTYNVQENQCQVRCIINSDCTVAALIQSTRDQGSVKGTLGENGESMCRMYYLPENALTRPGDMVVTSGVGLEFPKGIPIGQVRESTRGMEENKSYVVVDPVVDFQHLEYVTVYRYKPAYAEAAQQRSSSFDGIVTDPLSTARPVPTFMVGQVSDFLFTPTPAADDVLPEKTPAPTETPTATETPFPEGTPLPENKTYQAQETSGVTPTPSPRPTPTPEPTPAPTQDPGSMTVEED